MPWVFFALMIVYGLACIVFAFVEPPSALRSLFKVPAVFTFLPERWVMPAGRIFLGVCSLALVGVLSFLLLTH